MYTPGRIVLGMFLMAAFFGCQRAEMDMGDSQGLEVDASRLPMTSTDSDMAIFSDSTSRSLGTATSSIELFKEDDRGLLNVILIQNFRLGTMYDTLVVDSRTLRPIRYRNELTGFQTVKVDYSPDGRVTGQVIRDTTETAIDTTMTGVFFDAAGFQALIPALPLGDGYEVEIPVYNYQSGAATVKVKVVGSDSIEYEGEPRDIWLVAYSPNPNTTAMLSIDKSSGSILLAESDLGGGRTYRSIAN